jgi:hypothetical protein
MVKSHNVGMVLFNSYCPDYLTTLVLYIRLSNARRSQYGLRRMKQLTQRFLAQDPAIQGSGTTTANILSFDYTLPNQVDAV